MLCVLLGFFVKQMTAYELRISDWSSDVCSSDRGSGVAVQGRCVQHELAALGPGHRGGDRDLAAELIGRPGLALADALDLGGMQAVELPAALALPLATHLVGPRQRDGEGLSQRLALSRLSPDFADPPDRKSAGQGTSVSVRVNLGGCRI